MIRNSTIFLTWMPPFTLPTIDIAGYCVSVDMVTANSFPPQSASSMYTEYVEIPEFSCSIPDDDDDFCHSYSFTIFPVNAAGNGTSTNVSYTPVMAGRVIIF